MDWRDVNGGDVELAETKVGYVPLPFGETGPASTPCYLIFKTSFSVTFGVFSAFNYIIPPYEAGLELTGMKFFAVLFLLGGFVSNAFFSSKAYFDLFKFLAAPENSLGTCKGALKFGGAFFVSLFTALPELFINLKKKGDDDEYHVVFSGGVDWLFIFVCAANIPLYIAGSYRLFDSAREIKEVLYSECKTNNRSKQSNQPATRCEKFLRILLFMTSSTPFLISLSAITFYGVLDLTSEVTEDSGALYFCAYLGLVSGLVPTLGFTLSNLNAAVKSFTSKEPGNPEAFEPPLWAKVILYILGACSGFTVFNSAKTYLPRVPGLEKRTIAVNIIAWVSNFNCALLYNTPDMQKCPQQLNEALEELDEGLRQRPTVFF